MGKKKKKVKLQVNFFGQFSARFLFSDDASQSVVHRGQKQVSNVQSAGCTLSRYGRTSACGIDLALEPIKQVN